MQVTIHVSIPSTLTTRRQPTGNARSAATHAITKGATGTGSARNPLVIIRGCPSLQLSAQVFGQARHIWWSITPRSDSAHGASPPRLGYAEGKLNFLTTDAVGIYIVSAGYVVTPTQPDEEAALERTTLHVHFISGSVAFDSYKGDDGTEVSLVSASRIAITSKFKFAATTCFDCGGPRLVGALSRVKVGLIQNVTIEPRLDHELRAKYRRSKRSATTSFSSSRSAAPKFVMSRSKTINPPTSSEKSSTPLIPQVEEGWLFESGPTASSPFVDSQDDEDVPFYEIKLQGDGLVRTIKFSDAPGLPVPPYYIRSDPNIVLGLKGDKIQPLVNLRGGYEICQVNGRNLFRAAVVIFSLDAPSTYLVLGWLDWSVSLDQDLTVEFDDSRHGVKLTCGVARDQGTRFLGTRILSMPLEARAAGIEAYGPIAVGEGEDDANYRTYRWEGPG